VKNYDEIGQFIIDELAKELIKQDHKATGELIESIDYIINKGIFTEILIEMNDYGRYVNTGRKRGAKKVPIQALVEWIKQRGIETNNKKVVGMAFAIQKTIEREGIPTRNSRAKGKRTGFIDDTVTRIEQKVQDELANMMEKEVELMVINFAKKT